MTTNVPAWRAVRRGLTDEETTCTYTSTTFSDDGLLAGRPPAARRARISALAPQLRPVIETLEQFKDLPENWDSYGARPVEADCIIKALEVLREVTCWDTLAPYVFPTPAGGVQFEWHTRGIDLEIEIASPLHVVAYYEGPDPDSSDNEWEKDVSDDFSPLIVPIAKLRGTL